MMRTITRFLFTALLVFGVTSLVFAGEESNTNEAGKSKELKNQTLCPVMGGKIDSTAYSDIQGQRVYHCCPMCAAKLKADPDKYFKQAAAEGILFENIQTTCPVSGEKLTRKEVFVDYEGRRIYFCCENCPPKFMKDPQKYLTAMDNPGSIEQKCDDADHHMEGDESH